MFSLSLVKISTLARRRSCGLNAASVFLGEDRGKLSQKYVDIHLVLLIVFKQRVDGGVEDTGHCSDLVQSRVSLLPAGDHPISETCKFFAFGDGDAQLVATPFDCVINHRISLLSLVNVLGKNLLQNIR